MRIDAEEAKLRLCELLDRVAIGEEVIITKDGETIAKLIAIPSDRPKIRVFGSAKGEFTVPDDLDGPLAKEIEDLFYGE